jgi:hypothetical protein
MDFHKGDERLRLLQRLVTTRPASTAQFGKRRQQQTATCPELRAQRKERPVSGQPSGRSLQKSQSEQSLLKSVRCMQRLDQERTTIAWRQTANSFFAECVTGWRDVAEVRLLQRCNPGKKESRERDDHKPGRASEHIDCTEPPPDSLHGSRSTS